MINISHRRALDELDVQEISNSYKVFSEPSKYALNEESSNARCVSIGHDNIICLDGGDLVSGAYSDIFDDYDILPTILGTGNYGCVRECFHRLTGEIYAVKTIDKAKVTRRDHIQREIRLLRSVDHPGIMKMVDYYEDEAYVHIVTERCTGGELFKKIIDSTSGSGCLQESHAAKIIKALLEAVHYLHSRNVVHRDIKPENVLFESAEEGSSIKLIDFGLSRTHGIDDSAMTNRIGTPYYMSPGVLRGNYDRSCDIWAVGVVSYILLCGFPPFNGQSDSEVHASILRGSLAFEEDVWGHLSKASRDFVNKILGRDLSSIDSVEEALRHPWISSC